jgi:hypothetical protein
VLDGITARSGAQAKFEGFEPRPLGDVPPNCTCGDCFTRQPILLKGGSQLNDAMDKPTKDNFRGRGLAPLRQPGVKILMTMTLVRRGHKLLDRAAPAEVALRDRKTCSRISTSNPGLITFGLTDLGSSCLDDLLDITV